MDASWERLGGVWTRLEPNLSRLGGFLRRLESVFGSLRDVPGLVLGGSGGVFARFFSVFSRSQAKIEN